MAELLNQRINGTPMSEKDCFQQAIYHVRGLRDCVRGLALLRAGDQNHAFGWLSLVKILDQLHDNIQKMMVRGVNRTNLILPARFQ